MTESKQFGIGAVNLEMAREINDKEAVQCETISHPKTE